MKKHFVYKTSHKNGRYYIGRHSTENIDDGYLRSGWWIRKIKDKKSLTREILEFTDSIDKLLLLEEKYILKYFNDEFCMNVYPSARGHTTETSRKRNLNLSARGIHPWQLSNSNLIRVCCLVCKKDVNWPVFSYIHGDKCKELIPYVEIKLPGSGFKAGHAKRAGKIGGIKGGEYAKENKTGIHSITPEKNMIREFNSKTTMAIKFQKASKTIYSSVKEWPILSIRG